MCWLNVTYFRQVSTIEDIHDVISYITYAASEAGETPLEATTEADLLYMYGYRRWSVKYSDPGPPSCGTAPDALDTGRAL